MVGLQLQAYLKAPLTTLRGLMGCLQPHDRCSL